MANKIKQEFDNMKKMPIFEIDLKEYGFTEQEEFVYTNLSCDDEYISSDYGVRVKIDENYSLDEHLETLFEKWTDEVTKDYQQNNETNKEIAINKQEENERLRDFSSKMTFANLNEKEMKKLFEAYKEIKEESKNEIQQEVHFENNIGMNV